MSYVFFLGGNDLEMEAIRSLLASEPGAIVEDDRLTWGAKASAYADRITQALDGGRVPVLVELRVDLSLPEAAVSIVDHHGDRAGESAPTSLEQVFELLGRSRSEWTREMSLIAANDRGHIEGLQQAGATPDDIVRIRRADRRAQGVSDREEREAVEAITRADHPAPGLTVVRLPHTRTSPVTDGLHPALGGPGYDCLAVISPGEINVFADGAMIARLDTAFPGGWKGGALPHRGFWGRKGETASVLEFLRHVRAAA